MSKQMIVIVDLGHENSQMIKEDLESLGVEAVIVEHDINAAQLDELQEIKGFILNGGPHKTVGGFRVDASEDIYNKKLPMYSVDHAGLAGVDLYSWPDEQEERLRHIKYFLESKCNIEL